MTKKLCTYPSCRVVVDCFGDEKPRCDKHRQSKHSLVKEYKQHQLDANGRYFYHTAAWKNARATKLAHQPLCEDCLDEGRYKSADMVDHIVEIEDGGDKTDQSNLRSLCWRHHGKKTGQHKKRRNNKT